MCGSLEPDDALVSEVLLVSFDVILVVSLSDLRMLCNDFGNGVFGFC